MRGRRQLAKRPPEVPGPQLTLEWIRNTRTAANHGDGRADAAGTGPRHPSSQACATAHPAQGCTRRSTHTSRWSLDGNGKVPVSAESGSAWTGQNTAASRTRRSRDGST